MLPVYLLNPDSVAAKLAGLIELGLAEIQSGIRGEQSFRKFLSSHLLTPSIQIQQFPFNNSEDFTISSVSTTESTNLELSAQLPSWHSVPQVEYV